MESISSCQACKESFIVGKFDINAFNNKDCKSMLAGTIFEGQIGDID